jgi:hypothetical protein
MKKCAATPVFKQFATSRSVAAAAVQPIIHILSLGRAVGRGVILVLALKRHIL